MVPLYVSRGELEAEESYGAASRSSASRAASGCFVCMAMAMAMPLSYLPI